MKFNEVAFKYFGAVIVLCLGLGLGFWSASEQVAVESGYIISNVINGKMSLQSTDAIYNIVVWSLANQIPELIFTHFPSVTMPTLSNLLSALIAGLFSIGIYLFCLALGFNPVTSIIIVLTLFATKLYDNGITYPIHFFNTRHTYGMLGTSLSLFAFSLYGNEKRVLAFALTLLLISIHLVWGVATLGVLLLVWATEKFIIQNPNLIWKFKTLDGLILLFSILLLLASFLYQKMVYASLLKDLPEVSGALFNQTLRAYASGGGDMHRVPVDLSEPGFKLSMMAFVFSIVFLFTTAKRFENSLRLCLIASSLAIVLAVMTHLPFDWQPTVFLFAIPGRFLSWPILFFLPIVLFGVKEIFQKDSLGSRMMTQVSLFFCLFTLLFVTLRTSKTGFLTGNASELYFLFAVGMCACVYLLYKRQEKLGRIIQVLMGIFLMAFAFSQSVTEIKKVVPLNIKHFKNDSFWAKVNSDGGVLLTDQAYLTYTTGRLLLEGAGNEIYYSKKAMAFHLMVTKDFGEEPWSSFSSEKWAHLSKKYSFKQVLATKTSKFNLRLESENGQFKYWSID